MCAVKLESDCLEKRILGSFDNKIKILPVEIIDQNKRQSNILLFIYVFQSSFTGKKQLNLRV